MSRGTFYTVEKIGPNRAKTPEGFLLCRDVPVARTGMMLYGPDETPVPAGPDGIVKIFRDAEQVFRAETIASANGKAVVNDHPESDVLPENWKALSIGTMINVHRGEGVDDDLLLADLLIMDADGIALVESGKAEVSLGYDADYVIVEPGIGRQEDLYINHVAIVDEGRCGPRCAIRDCKPKDLEMTTTAKTVKTNDKKAAVTDSLKRWFTQAFKAKDSAEVEKLVNDAAAEMEEQGATGDTHVHVHTGDSDEERWSKNDAEHKELRDRIEALEKALTAGKGKDGVADPDPNKNTQGKADGDPTEVTSAKDGKGKDSETPEEKEKREKEEADKKAADAARAAEDDEVRADEMAMDEVPEDLKEEVKKNKDKARDSAFLGDTLREVASMAEILVPGIQIPTYDMAARPGKTAKQLCAFRRTALDAAYKDGDTATLIDQLLGGKKLDTKNMTCDAARTLFRSAAAMKQQLNNAKTVQRGTQDGGYQPATTLTLAEINARNAAHWASKS